jgi:hypothetical protein
MSAPAAWTRAWDGIDVICDDVRAERAGPRHSAFFVVLALRAEHHAAAGRPCELCVVNETRLAADDDFGVTFETTPMQPARTGSTLASSPASDGPNGCQSWVSRH